MVPNDNCAAPRKIATLRPLERKGLDALVESWLTTTDLGAWLISQADRPLTVADARDAVYRLLEWGLVEVVVGEFGLEVRTNPPARCAEVRAALRKALS